jgi:hypothetical protein
MAVAERPIHTPIRAALASWIGSAAFYAEMFDTPVRLSGMPIPTTQIGFVPAAFAPTIAAALKGGDAGAWAATAREAYRLDIHELGSQEAVQSASFATAF